MKILMELEEYEALLVAKTTAKDYEGAILLLNSISYIHRTMGKWEQSLECLLDALSMAKKHSKLATGNILCSLGALYIEKGEIQKAITYLKDSLDYMEKIEKCSKLASAYGNLGKANLFLGCWDEAIHFVKKALEIAMEEKLDSNIMSSYTCLGKIESERGNFDEARKYFSLADEVERKIYEAIEATSNHHIEYKRNKDGSDTKEQIIRDIVHICELNIAESIFLRYQCKFEEASEKADRAKEIAHQISYSYGEMDASLELAKIHANTHASLEIQKRDIEGVIKNARSLGAKAQEAEAKLQYASILVSEGSLCKSREIFEQSIKLFEDIGNLYSVYVAKIYKGVFLFDGVLNKRDAISIMTGMQKIRELGKAAENIELIEKIQKYIILTSECVEKKIVEILDVTHNENINLLTENESKIVLNKKYILQSKILDVVSFLRILERSCTLVYNLSPNKGLKEKSQLLKDATIYLIRVAESLNETYCNQASIYESKLREYRQEVESKQNILLQILQATLAGVGVTGIFTTILSSSIEGFQYIHLFVLALTFISWGMLPVMIYFGFSQTKCKRKKFLALVFDIGFIILSIGLFVISLMQPALLDKIISVLR